jgi:hypothetical protein
MPSDELIRNHLVWLLQGGDAHMTFREVISGFPLDRINELFPNGTYSAWALLEHLRITQWDILDFITNSDYKSLQWPKEYWPAQDKQATPEDWHTTIAKFEKDQKALVRIVEDPKTDLYSPIAHGTGQTILREVLLVGDHNAYHIGEFAIMRQVMGTWPKDRC